MEYPYQFDGITLYMPNYQIVFTKIIRPRSPNFEQRNKKARPNNWTPIEKNFTTKNQFKRQRNL